MVEHFTKAEWTHDLHQDILNFNIEAAFMANPEWISAKHEHLKWDGIALWLDLIFWAKENVSGFLY